MAKGDKPHYRVGALNKATDEKSTVGVAYANPDGTVTVLLHSFVVLEGSKNLLLTLFPNT